jgi:hypothetical protein
MVPAVCQSPFRTEIEPVKRPMIAPARDAFLLMAALALTLAAGCGGDEEASGVTVVEELRGDTVVMVSSGEPERVRIDEVEVLWQSDEFDGARMPQMARFGDHLVIGDLWRVHVVSIQDGEARTFGRRGQGPGEIRTAIRSVGGFEPDTIAVLDEIQVLLFSLDGEFLTSHQTTGRLPFSGHVMGGSAADRLVYPLARSGRGMLWARMTHESPERKALLWHDLEADTVAVLETWDYRGTEPIFFELVKHAIASDGRVATGDPADYCIRLFHAFEEGGRTGCRERSRVPVEEGFKNRSGPDAPWNPQGDPTVRRLEANPPDVLPHFDRLLFSESGDLWVNLYHEDFAHVHRLAYSAFDWQPTVHEWEVFDRDAVLVRHVTLPGTFDLRVIGDGEAFGFFTLDTGEIVVGRVDLTGSVVPPT